MPSGGLGDDCRGCDMRLQQCLSGHIGVDTFPDDDAENLPSLPADFTSNSLVPMFNMVPDRVLLGRTEADMQSKWPPSTIRFRPGQQAAEAHIALQLVAGHRCEFGCHMTIAKVFKQNTFDKLSLPLVHVALSECTGKQVEVDLSIKRGAEACDAGWGSRDWRSLFA